MARWQNRCSWSGASDRQLAMRGLRARSVEGRIGYVVCPGCGRELKRSKAAFGQGGLPQHTRGPVKAPADAGSRNT